MSDKSTLTHYRCHVLQVTENEREHKELLLAVQPHPDMLIERASSASEALSMLRSAPLSARPNLLITSWILPVISGEELLRIVKTDPLLKSIPVVVLAPSIPRPATDNLYNLGASCVIQTPTDVKAFGESMRLLYAFWAGVASLPFCEPPSAREF